jgi:hypothetical protein
MQRRSLLEPARSYLPAGRSGALASDRWSCELGRVGVHSNRRGEIRYYATVQGCRHPPSGAIP